jgi:hypothetical protein
MKGKVAIEVVTVLAVMLLLSILCLVAVNGFKGSWFRFAAINW